MTSKVPSSNSVMERVCGRRMIDDKAATNTTMDRAASAMLSCDRESSVYFSRLISRLHQYSLRCLIHSWGVALPDNVDTSHK